MGQALCKRGKGKTTEGMETSPSPAWAEHLLRTEVGIVARDVSGHRSPLSLTRKGSSVEDSPVVAASLASGSSACLRASRSQSEVRGTSSSAGDRRLSSSVAGAKARGNGHVESQIKGLDSGKVNGRRGTATDSLDGPNGPTCRYGTSLSDLYAHSWQRILAHSWQRISKRAVLGELGFIARVSEVHRLGRRARVVQRNLNHPPPSRSFTEVVREGGMDRGRGQPPRRFGDDSRG